MSEWFKEHDWKSCDGGDSSGGSNPLLCATRSPPQSGLFAWRREEVREVRHSPEVARGGGEARRGERAETKPDDEALPRGPPQGCGKILCATQSPPQSGLFAWRREEVREVRHSPEVARGGGEARRGERAETKPDDEALPRGPPQGCGKILCATQSPPQSGLFAWRREEAGEVRHSPEVARALPARTGAERSEYLYSSLEYSSILSGEREHKRCSLFYMTQNFFIQKTCNNFFNKTVYYNKSLFPLFTVAVPLHAPNFFFKIIEISIFTILKSNFAR